ncbi:hypothetical protein ACH4SP_12350 [Streptomyces sp. NPDC021093]|uniref:hypothetical protein n=1 Tax=Streptomyces sp. NPDC021093 TaxID=3365112 RepID=UPI0037A978EB
MKSHNQARSNAARRRQAEAGGSYAAALQAVRRDRSAGAEECAEPARAQTGRTIWDFHDMPVPEVLTELVRYHSNRIGKHLHLAMDEGRWNTDFAEWQAMTLYKLTDALEHLHLLIGTISAYLRNEGVSRYSLRRYLQVNDDRKVEAYFTPVVEEHLAGLTGQEAPGDACVWYAVGSGIAGQTGWCDSERNDTLEAALHALYGNYPDGEQDLDHLPEPLRAQVLAFLAAPHPDSHSDCADSKDAPGRVVADDA